MRSSALLAFLVLAGCSESHGPGRADAGTATVVDAGRVAFVVSDTQGWSLTLSHSPTARPQPRSEESLPFPHECVEGSPHGAIDWGGRVLVIQARCDGVMREIMDRAVVCEINDDCAKVRPWLQTLFEDDEIPARLECRNGLCQMPEQPIDRGDVYALCLAETPRWRDFWDSRSEESGYRELRTIVEEHCRDGSCAVPEGCRQP